MSKPASYSTSYLVADSFLEENKQYKDRIIREYDEEYIIDLIHIALGVEGLKQGSIKMMLEKTVENIMGCEKHTIILYVEEGNSE